MSRRGLIAKLKRIAVHDEQVRTIRQISGLIDELSAAATGSEHQPNQSLTQILEGQPDEPQSTAR